MFLSSLAFFLAVARPAVFARPRPSLSLKNASPRAVAARDSTEDPCFRLFEENSVSVFNASEVLACARTIPFNATVASQFIQYYKDTVVFQSTLTYLKTPTASYQQPATDLLGNLNLIQAAINSDVFTNEFDFEQTVLRAVYATHEGHLWLDFGATAPFSFGSPYTISSVSSDGIEPPKPYLTDHLVALGSSASPISKINGVDAVVWLTQFAADNSFGLLDPNADWNALIQTPAGDIQQQPSAFNGDSPFFPGNDLIFELKNGTSVPTRWRALVDAFGAPPINNASDFSEFFVLGIITSIDDDDDPDDTTPTAALSAAGPSAAATSGGSSAAATFGGSSAAVTSSTPTAANWYDATHVMAYPSNPVVIQPDLGIGGFVTGYFLDDGSTAVLSIPSFEMTGSAVLHFSTTIGQFISKSKAAGRTKMVIDLQQNLGGNILLAIDAFKQFFPSIDPFGGSRMRDTGFSDALGTTFTQFAASQGSDLDQSDRDVLTNLPWEVLDYIDAASGVAFASWPEFFGPHADHDDLFSTVQQDNLSSTLFDEIATGGFNSTTFSPLGIVIYGFGNRSNVGPQPFAAEDMVILTDGICHSSCALFAEMLHHEAGVKTVVVGGRPSIGPMQAIAGTRGAASYYLSELDIDIATAINVNSNARSQLPASHQVETDLWIQDASFNLRDQIRRNEYFPLQFAYEAADCRIYWTLNSFNNFTNLWQHVADAMWTNSSLCVKDSTVFASNNGTDVFGPSQAQLESWGGYGSPSPLAILPPDVTVATPAPVAQQPDGQPFATAAASPVAYNPIPALASTAPDASSDEETEDAHLAEDSRFPIFTTLNKPCSSDLKCNIHNHERCEPASECLNGAYVTVKKCKKECVKTSQCASGNSFICNTFDVRCFLLKGSEKCLHPESNPDFPGSGTRTTTVIVERTQDSFIQLQKQGFCEPRVQPNAHCMNLIDANLAGSDNKPIPPSDFNQPNNGLIVNVPVDSDDQGDDVGRPVNAPDASLPGARISDIIISMFGF